MGNQLSASDVNFSISLHVIRGLLSALQFDLGEPRFLGPQLHLEVTLKLLFLSRFAQSLIRFEIWA
jgi:hypothetical protein